ncbi:hypothetical protein MLD38_015266 [Melastoma candidum]|uniref:Uncharacterized protein n=1 Tax=Melastoma candidum TaxID=119954 RepID=A0ACB9RFN7_9MYRT|nr:hypothetical protein MLD38_015266 [Melastoma candidum]
MMGKKAIDSARIFVEESGISDSLSPEEFLIQREDRLMTMFPNSARRLVRHLHAKGIPIAVATGSTKQHFELKTQRHEEIFSFMHHIVNGEHPEVKRGKPAPDVFLAAAKRFEGESVNPGSVLVFEDAPAGVNPTKSAGMYVVMVPDPRLDSSLYGLADHVLKSQLDFDPTEWGLPPFESEES